MLDDTSRERSDYIVGYRRPPKATQFKPGRSGNPKGRPKGSQNMRAIVNNVLSQKVTVTEGGRTRRMSTLEVIMRRLVNESMKVQPNALKLLLSLVERYSEPPEKTCSSEALLVEDQAILARFLEDN